MLQQKNKNNKTIYVYLLFLILISSINNKNFDFKQLLQKKLIFEVSGLSNKDNQELKNKLIIANNDNIFNLNKNKLSNIIVQNNLALDFLIKKNYPNKVKIYINRAELIGKVFKNNKLSIIGSNGKLIEHQTDIETDLPYFYGKFKRDEFLKFLKILRQTNFKTENVLSFYFFPSGRWDINFKDGKKFKLPIQDTKNSLIKALKLSKDKKNFNNLQIIDLRMAGKIILND